MQVTDKLVRGPSAGRFAPAFDAVPAHGGAGGGGSSGVGSIMTWNSLSGTVCSGTEGSTKGSADGK